MGVIESRKVNSDTFEFLVSLGLEMRKKEVYVWTKGRKAESSLNRSILNRSNNDKNKRIEL